MLQSKTHTSAPCSLKVQYFSKIQTTVPLCSFKVERNLKSDSLLTFLKARYYPLFAASAVFQPARHVWSG